MGDVVRPIFSAAARAALDLLCADCARLRQRVDERCSGVGAGARFAAVLAAVVGDADFAAALASVDDVLPEMAAAVRRFVEDLQTLVAAEGLAAPTPAVLPPPAARIRIWNNGGSTPFATPLRGDAA